MLTDLGMVLVSQALAQTILTPERCVAVARRLVLRGCPDESNGDSKHRLSSRLARIMQRVG